MTDRILSLDEARYARTLLEEEKASLLPSKFQLIAYKLFNVLAFALLISFLVGGLGVIGGEILDWDWGFFLGCISLFVIGALTLFLIPVFLFNLPLVFKFRRLAEFQRELGLTAALKAVFRRERQKSRLRNYFTLLGVVVGIGLAVYVIGLYIADHWDEGHGWLDAEDLLLLSLVALLAVSLVSLHFMRRAKERFEVVSRLLDSFTEETADSVEADRNEVAMPADSYESVAKLERQRILLERKDSILAASKTTDVSRFALQRSRELHAALDELDAEARGHAEEAIYSLMHEAKPAAASTDEESGLRVLPIAEIGMELLYEVDKELKRIRLYRMRPATGAAASDGGEASS